VDDNVKIRQAQIVKEWLEGSMKNNLQTSPDIKVGLVHPKMKIVKVIKYSLLCQSKTVRASLERK